MDKDLRTPELKQLANGTHRYRLDGPVKAKKIVWTYFVSNAAALSQRELQTLPVRSVPFPNLDESEDARAHTVRVETGQLVLSVEFEGSDCRLNSCQLLAEERADDLEERQWRVDKAETDRCNETCTIDVQPTKASVTIDGPRLGTRYSLVYKPAGEREADGGQEHAYQVAQKVLERTRTVQSSLANELSALLSKVVAQHVNGVTRFTGHVWDHRRRLLLTAFGDFPNQSWNSRFGSGDGVAGHCFRFSKPVAWARPANHENDEKGFRSSVIYQDYPHYHNPSAVRYSWVVALPLLAKGGISVGVLGFAGRDDECPVLRDICRDPNNARSLGQLGALTASVNVSFWAALSSTPEFQQESDFCKSCVDAVSNS